MLRKREETGEREVAWRGHGRLGEGREGRARRAQGHVARGGQIGVWGAFLGRFGPPGALGWPDTESPPHPCSNGRILIQIRALGTPFVAISVSRGPKLIYFAHPSTLAHLSRTPLHLGRVSAFSPRPSCNSCFRLSNPLWGDCARMRWRTKLVNGKGCACLRVVRAASARCAGEGGGRHTRNKKLHFLFFLLRTQFLVHCTPLHGPPLARSHERSTFAPAVSRLPGPG